MWMTRKTSPRVFFLVCMFREALDEKDQSGLVASVDRSTESTATDLLGRFEHYEILKRADGTPIELGRGAMGVTYKAFDIDLHCPVTLKVISDRYFGDELVRLRFLREPQRQRVFATRMLSQFSTWVEPARVTFTRWSLWREKRSRLSLNVQAASK